MHSLRWLTFLLIGILLIPFAHPAAISWAPVSVHDVSGALALNSPDNHTRYLRLRKLFDSAGCHQEYLEELKIRRASEPDLVCTLPGVLTPGSAPDPRRLILFARYDHAGPGSGLIDNWSGAVMLPLLFASVFPGYREHTIQFVATFGQDGLPVFLKSLKRQQKDSTVALVDLRDLGMDTTHMDILDDASSAGTTINSHGRGSVTYSSQNTSGANTGPEDLRMYARRASGNLTRLGIPLLGHPYTLGFFNTKPQNARDEAIIILDSAIPGVIIHSITKDNATIPGTDADTPERFNQTAYYATYYYIAVYLLLLDHPPGPGTPEKVR